MIKIKEISAYAPKRPTTIGLSTVLLALVFGASIALATGFVTPSQIYAQVAGPPCDCAPAPTPPPPPPPVSSTLPITQPVPTCALSANPSSLAYGGGLSTLSWTTTAGTSASIDNGAGSVSPVDSGSKLVFVAVTTKYTMTVYGPGGETTCYTNVTVAPPPPAPACSPVWNGCGAYWYSNSCVSSCPVGTQPGRVTGPNNAQYCGLSYNTCVPSTPPPPPPPLPTCTLIAKPTAIQSGSSSTLSWTTNSTDSSQVSLTIDHGIGQVPITGGSIAVSPTVTTTYTGTIFDNNGGFSPQYTGHCSTTITVTQQPPPPPPAAPTCTLTASPSSIQTGSSSTLKWTTTNADSFSIDRGIGSVTPVSSGSKNVSPTNTLTYTGTAKGPGGSVNCTATVTVTSTPPPPSAPTCTLTASPTSVNAGDHTTLTWTTTNAGTFSIDNGIGAVSPALGGSVSSKAITNDTTFTGTLVSPSGQTVTCTAVVSVNHGGGGGGGPSCTLAVSPSSYTTGGSATLSWGGSEISNVDIDNGIATATSSPGSTTVSPVGVGTYTYTGTFHAQNGQTLTCAATLTVTGGSGGCTNNCGGGGGGPPPPTIVLSALPHASTQPLAYLYLSQIPYTGLDLGPVGTVLYWLALILWSLALAYLILFGALPGLYRSAHLFGKRVSFALNAQEHSADVHISPKVPAPQMAFQPALETVPQAPRGYSAYDGFKSFAHNGALSIEDIVKGLSHQSSAPTAPVAERAPEPVQNTEPIYEKVEPIHVAVEPIATRAAEVNGNGTDTASAHVRGFVSALVEGDRAAVFAGLRELVRGGGKAEQMLAAAACLLDDVYRARIDGTACDADVARLTARLDTPRLEQLIAALANAIDSSYSTGVTGAKLALTRALAVLGA
ncbi:MAG: hypothetical protein KGJ31_01450 [Patescibacteria group bacterium]|nr:hypothetical protein [Patescibacteria group bacterium]